MEKSVAELLALVGCHNAIKQTLKRFSPLLVLSIFVTHESQESVVVGARKEWLEVDRLHVRSAGQPCQDFLDLGHVLG